MSKIVTDNKALEEPKDPETNNIFKLYELLASESDAEDMRKKFIAGNYGYGHAKTALFEIIMDRFSQERKDYNRYMENHDELEKALNIGADKARVVAQATLKRVREKLGFKV